MIIAGTGHRPHTLGGYGDDVFKRLVRLAEHAVLFYNPTVVISGMALGWDMALAEAAITLDIPLHAYVPFEGQANRWPPASQAQYQRLLAGAHTTVVCSPGGFSAAAMQRRNERMVDDCQLLLALWNGSSGGTANCMRYAEQRERKHFNLWSMWSTP